MTNHYNHKSYLSSSIPITSALSVWKWTTGKVAVVLTYFTACLACKLFSAFQSKLENAVRVGCWSLGKQVRKVGEGRRYWAPLKHA